MSKKIAPEILNVDVPGGLPSEVLNLEDSFELPNTDETCVRCCSLVPCPAKPPTTRECYVPPSEPAPGQGIFENL